MASYALIPILSGFSFHLPKKYIGFCPCRSGDFDTIWSAGNAWGSFSVRDAAVRFSIEEGSLCLSSFGLSFCDAVSALKIDGKETAFSFCDGLLTFPETTVSQGLEITL